LNDFEVAIEVAEAGAAVVRHRFGTTLQRLDKGVGDFATNADVAAGLALCERAGCTRIPSFCWAFCLLGEFS
jgi:myo-inositol-1(or 4)-monophosphatase